MGKKVLPSKVASYLVPHAEFFKADGALAAVGGDGLEPELGELLDERLHGFSLLRRHSLEMGTELQPR